MLKKHTEGDKNQECRIQLTDEQKKLVEDNHNLIYFTIHKYNLDIEEYYDIFALALCKAAINYDINKGPTFSTYAVWAMKNEFLLSIRKAKAQRRSGTCISINDVVYDNTSDDSSITLEDMLTNGLDAFDESILLDFTKLNDKLRRILWLSYCGYTQKEIADIIGITQAMVSRDLKKAKKLLED